MICDFEDNGNIFISCEFGEMIKDISEIDSVLKNSANQVIQTIGEFLQKNGYTINDFDSILRENIEIIQMKLNVVSCRKTEQLNHFFILLVLNERGNSSIRRLSKAIMVSTKTIYRYCEEYKQYVEVEKGFVRLRRLSMVA